MLTRLKKLAKRLSFAATLAVFLSATATVVYASDIYYQGKDTYGYSYYTSCGSSAGPSSWRCPPQGGSCEDVTDYRTAQFCNLPVN